MKTSTSIALKWGLISGIISFISSFFQQYSGLMDDVIEENAWLSVLIGSVLTVTFIFLCLKEYRLENNDELSYGKGVGLSTMLGAITGLVAGIFNFIYLKFIDNGYLERQLDKLRDQWDEQGLSSAQIEQAEKMIQMFMGPGVQMVIIVLFSIIFHVLISLVVSAVLKREKPIFD